MQKKPAIYPAAKHRPHRSLRSLPAEPMSVGVARRWLRSGCGHFAGDELCEDAELVMSELVGNAVRHADGPVDVEVSAAAGGGLWLSVRDTSTRPVQHDQVDLLSESGRGLGLVDLLSSRWGVDADRSGKRVWAELEPC